MYLKWEEEDAMWHRKSSLCGSHILHVSSWSITTLIFPCIYLFRSFIKYWFHSNVQASFISSLIKIPNVSIQPRELTFVFRGPRSNGLECFHQRSTAQKRTKGRRSKSGSTKRFYHEKLKSHFFQSAKSMVMDDFHTNRRSRKRWKWRRHNCSHESWKIHLSFSTKGESEKAEAEKG